MRPIGMLISTLVAALALLVFVGTAAAEKEATVACPEAPISGDECEGEAFEAGTAITASSEEIVLTVEDVVPLFGIDGVVKCESALAGEPVEDTVEPPLLTGDLSTLSFTNCEEVLTSSPCTVTTVGLPYETQLEHELSTPGDGELFVYEDPEEGSRPGATLFCEKTPVAINCTYLVDENAAEIEGGATDLARLEFDGSSEPTITADEVKFEESSGTCPGQNPEMDGEWVVEEPSALFVAQKRWDYEVKPDPIPFAKVNDTISVEVKNTGKTDWTLIIMGAPRGLAGLRRQRLRRQKQNPDHGQSGLEMYADAEMPQKR